MPDHRQHGAGMEGSFAMSQEVSNGRVLPSEEQWSEIERRLSHPYGRASFVIDGFDGDEDDDLEDDDLEKDGFWAPEYQGGPKVWFNLEFLGRSCAGTGGVDCHCGGDLCVCGWHGEAECLGCDDCEMDADDYEDYGY